MTCQIAWSDESIKNLRSIDKKMCDRVIAKVERIKENPFNFVKRLAGMPLFSLRVGDYRAIMDIKNSQMLIFVVRVGHRKSIYGEL